MKSYQVTREQAPQSLSKTKANQRIVQLSPFFPAWEKTMAEYLL